MMQQLMMEGIKDHFDAGGKKLDYDCTKSGCFNVTRRPKLEVFFPCFPGRIGFGDIDGLVELERNLCFLEWKSPGAKLKLGQQKLYLNATAMDGDHVAFLVEGTADDMHVVRYKVFWKGQEGEWVSGTLADVQQRIWNWSALVAPHRFEGLSR